MLNLLHIDLGTEISSKTCFKSDCDHVYVCVLYVCVQLCLTLCDSMNCSLPGPSIHGIFQERILEWVAIFYSRGSSRPRD